MLTLKQILITTKNIQDERLLISIGKKKAALINRFWYPVQELVVISSIISQCEKCYFTENQAVELLSAIIDTYYKDIVFENNQPVPANPNEAVGGLIFEHPEVKNPDVRLN